MSARWDNHLRAWKGPGGDVARELWFVVSSAVPGLADPYASALETGGVMFAWDREEHHFDIEMVPDGAIEWFYRNRRTDECDGSEDPVQYLPLRARELLRLLSPSAPARCGEKVGPSMTEHGRSSFAPARRPTCLCGLCGIRNDRWDAYFCPASGAWLEGRCGDPTCRTCHGRPDTATAVEAEGSGGKR